MNKANVRGNLTLFEPDIAVTKARGLAYVLGYAMIIICKREEELIRFRQRGWQHRLSRRPWRKQYSGSGPLGYRLHTASGQYRHSRGLLPRGRRIQVQLCKPLLSACVLTKTLTPAQSFNPWH